MGAHFLNQFFQGENPAGYKLQTKPQGGLQSDHATGGIVKFSSLSVTAEGMICGNHINGPIPESLFEGRDIFNSPERRVDFGIYIKFPDSLIRQGEVVGAVSAVTRTPLALASRISRTDPMVLTWAYERAFR